MKIIRWIWDNILLLASLFLLAFIPLYPKLPVLDIQNTWVYIRAEDFIVVFVFLLWIVLMFLKKVTFKTPLTMPIILFWIVGSVSTLHGILLIFPTLGTVFPNVALLSYLRRIEYLSLFFIAYSSVKDKRLIPYVVAVLTITLLCVIGYGFGQKFYGFPAYLTMNEEFAKGIPIRLSSLSRISSTFAGHYDLAAYLVLIIPILTSMIFGFRKLIVKLLLVITVFLGFILLFMTVSRVSFFVLLLSMITVLMFQKKKLAILTIIFLVLGIFIVSTFSTSLMQRFGNTVKEVDVLVTAKTGEAIGSVKEVSSEQFRGKIIRRRLIQNKRDVDAAVGDRSLFDPKTATDPAQLIPFSLLPPTVSIFIEPNSPNGESLPQGTGYINLTLAPIEKKLDQFFFKKTSNQGSPDSDEVFALEGNFLIKRVQAYDLSFTTRFQGEWPRAIAIFKKDVLFGGGYSTIGLAVDNNYLRILGEVGLLGFFSYFGILLVVAIYIKKILPEVDSPVVRSFVFGFIAGSVGLALNAVLIDVFEASKIAFVFWLLIGVTIGTLHLYQNKEIDIYREIKKTITSTYAIILYLFIVAIVTFSAITNYYFVGDDFTWFRWIADCKNGFDGLHRCQSTVSTVLSYFTEANGFFYRPGTKLYFQLMYSSFWLNQSMYHMVSILLHFTVATLLFLISKKILKSFLLSSLAAFLFIILSGYSEAVLWISSTGFLFNSVFILLSLLLFITWKEKKKNIFLFLCVLSITLSLLFHELGLVAPFIIVLYEFVFGEKFNFKDLFKKSHYMIIFSPILPYLGLRFLAQSHWFNGDYSYNLLKLPYNVVGNVIGYLALDLIGPNSFSFYNALRNFSRGHMVIVTIVSIAVIIGAILIYKIVSNKITKEDRKIITFGFLFFMISLSPFLGLGNITSRYSYLSSIGFIILFVFLIKKIYDYLIFNGRQIALTSIILLVSIFCLVQVIQLQKVHKDWADGGEKSKKIITSLNEIYTDEWTKESVDFYFINVPIRHGDAWVFPVGLSDAVWFVFRNERLNVYTYNDLNLALNAAGESKTAMIFEFDKNGNLIQVIKAKDLKLKNKSL